MAHLHRHKDKLLHRIKRLQGQMSAVHRAIEEDQDCSAVLPTLAAARGAMNALLAEIIEGHMREHIVDPGKRPDTPRRRAAQELIDVVRAYVT
jgi:FrmR/RcnR family transcriptional regulator, repressor of frmRAB operon